MAKILVVEDETDLRETLVEELNDEGHLTIEAGNGREGLERLASDAPDMIISDITMPEMNGYQFFRSVKEKFPEHEFTPFIFLSALSDRDNQLKGLRLGVDDYLTKPVDFDLLMAKVDLNLRRHMVQAKRPQPAAPSAGEPAPPAGAGSDLTPLQKLAALVGETSGKLLAGRMETADADLLDARFGEQSSETAAQIQDLAIATLRDRLGAKDVVQALPPNGILVCFADLSEDRLGSRLGELRDALWDALFSRWKDEDLTRLEAQSGFVTLDPDHPIEEDGIFAVIDQRLREEVEASRETNRTSLLENYRQKSLFALKLLTPASAPSKIKMLNFDRSILLENRKLLNEGHFERAFQLELYANLVKRLTEKKAFREAFSKGALLLPVRFDLVDGKAARAPMTELCQTLKERLGATIILELIDTPDRFHAHIDALKPLPIGGQVHFVELRRLEQLGSLELEQLKDLGVAFFTMRFEHALLQDADTLRHLIQTLEGNGVKFCIKEIPDGRLSDAQAFGAHLYATH